MTGASLIDLGAKNGGKVYVGSLHLRDLASENDTEASFPLSCICVQEDKNSHEDE